MQLLCVIWLAILGYIFTQTITNAYNPFHAAKSARMYNFKWQSCPIPLRNLTFSLKTLHLKSCMTVPSVTVCTNVQNNWPLPVSTPPPQPSTHTNTHTHIHSTHWVFAFSKLFVRPICQSKICNVSSSHIFFSPACSIWQAFSAPSFIENWH